MTIPLPPQEFNFPISLHKVFYSPNPSNPEHLFTLGPRVPSLVVAPLSSSERCPRLRKLMLDHVTLGWYPLSGFWPQPYRRTQKTMNQTIKAQKNTTPTDIRMDSSW